MSKTILLPIYNGMRARNFFRTDTYRELVQDQNLRLVVVIPPAKLEFYRSEFPEKNVIFEPHDVELESGFGSILYETAFNLLYTNTIRSKQWLEYLRSERTFKYKIRYVFKWFLNTFFGLETRGAYHRGRKNKQPCRDDPRGRTKDS